jgi:hypothetical protein
VQSEFTNVNSLHSALTAAWPGRCLVGIEGHSTSGKTMLAKALATVGGGAFFSTDGYARQRRPGERYQDLVDLARLRRDVSATGGSLILIEGICLRDVLDAAGLRTDTSVYVKRISPAGLWADDPENYVTDGVPSLDLSWVDEQAVSYHVRTSPLERADYVYLHHET